jgi:hypothetical protein
MIDPAECSRVTILRRGEPPWWRPLARIRYWRAYAYAASNDAAHLRAALLTVLRVQPADPTIYTALLGHS